MKCARLMRWRGRPWRRREPAEIRRAPKAGGPAVTLFSGPIVGRSIVGVSYGLGGSTVTTRAPDTKADRRQHQVDLGLRFSPSIELRYSF